MIQILTDSMNYGSEFRVPEYSVRGGLNDALGNVCKRNNPFITLAGLFDRETYLTIR